jgi:hypothetical protein
MKTRTENDIAHEIVDAAFHIHKALGPGLLETVYEVNFGSAVIKDGISRIVNGLEE